MGLCGMRSGIDAACITQAARASGVAKAGDGAGGCRSVGRRWPVEPEVCAGGGVQRKRQGGPQKATDSAARDDVAHFLHTPQPPAQCSATPMRRPQGPRPCTCSAEAERMQGGHFPPVPGRRPAGSCCRRADRRAGGSSDSPLRPACSRNEGWRPERMRRSRATARAGVAEAPTPNCARRPAQACETMHAPTAINLTHACIWVLHQCRVARSSPAPRRSASPPALRRRLSRIRAQQGAAGMRGDLGPAISNSWNPGDCCCCKSIVPGCVCGCVCAAAATGDALSCDGARRGPGCDSCSDRWISFLFQPCGRPTWSRSSRVSPHGSQCTSHPPGRQPPRGSTPVGPSNHLGSRMAKGASNGSAAAGPVKVFKR